MPKLFAIDPKQIDMFWGAVRPLIERAMDYSPYDDADTVHEALKKEEAYLWLIWSETIEAVVVTRLDLAKAGKICTIWACAGSGLASWVDLIGGIEDWARREGCIAVSEIGRPELARVLKRHGYKPTHIRLEKAL